MILAENDLDYPFASIYVHEKPQNIGLFLTLAFCEFGVRKNGFPLNLITIIEVVSSGRTANAVLW